jgi:hypothetical protein
MVATKKVTTAANEGGCEGDADDDRIGDEGGHEDSGNHGRRHPCPVPQELPAACEEGSESRRVVSEGSRDADRRRSEGPAWHARRSGEDTSEGAEKATKAATKGAREEAEAHSMKGAKNGLPAGSSLTT